jgi:SAM-dependent methyltransferase
VTRLPRLLDATERMDRPDADPNVLAASLAQVAAVNRWLGGTRALLAHLDVLLPDNDATLLDVGTGSADLPRAIAAHRRGRGLTRVIALDLHPVTLAVARDQNPAHPGLAFCQADALALPLPDGAVDVALLSMTLHHFDGDDQVAVLRELGRVARRGVLVGELERSWPAYAGARLLAATVWRRNAITRHDGPVSVRRAFTAAELAALARRARLRDVSVHRHPLFRLVLRARPPARGGSGVAP